jgi:hypothetical protein
MRNGKADKIPFPVRKETYNLYRQLDGYGMNPDLPVDPAALFRWSMFTQGALKRTFSTEPITVPARP